MAGSGTGPPEFKPVALDRTSPQLTLRAILTGMVLGSLLSFCTVYVGLKTGLPFGASLTAALLAYGLWAGIGGLSGGRARAWGLLENNISQTASSAAASVASAGLVAPIPALTLLTGRTLPWHWLAIWMFSVMLLGIGVAVPLRRQMIIVEGLPFPAGVASAEMLRELHSRGAEALKRLVALISGGGVAVAVALLAAFRLLMPCALPLSIKGIPLRTLTITLNPTVLLVGIGGLIGFRACSSLLIGALVAYLILAPWLIANEYIVPAAEEAASAFPSYRALNEWLLWPGVTLMVIGALVSLFLSWRSIVAVLPGWRPASGREDAGARGTEFPRGWFTLALLGLLVFSVALQTSLFEIAWWAAVIGVLLSFALAHVAARVTGETGMGAVGAMGKITQLAFGALIPKAPVPNLMAANVTGGAASQCADLLDDLKCGYLLGASPRAQTLAQVCGAAAGAMVGSAAYLVLVPDAAGMLTTPEWPAPAAVAWKSVAELFLIGFDALPAGIPAAMAIAAAVGIVLPVLARLGPRPLRPLVLSPVSLGLAFVLPASVSLPIFIGGLLALLLRRWVPSWSARFLVAVCVGLIAGESLTGIGLKFQSVFAG